MIRIVRVGRGSPHNRFEAIRRNQAPNSSHAARVRRRSNDNYAGHPGAAHLVANSSLFIFRVCNDRPEYLRIAGFRHAFVNQYLRGCRFLRFRNLCPVLQSPADATAASTKPPAPCLRGIIFAASTARYGIPPLSTTIAPARSSGSCTTSQRPRPRAAITPHDEQEPRE